MRIPFQPLCLFLALAALPAEGSAEASEGGAKPKYGPEAIPLSVDSSFFRRAPAPAAPDYWMLSPYYVHQQDGRSCSVASVAMVVNAVRAVRGEKGLPKLTADDELVTQEALLGRVHSAPWDAWQAPWWKFWSPETRGGVTLDQLGVVLGDSLRYYGVKDFKVTVVHADDTGEAARKALQETLAENEKSSRDFIILNFLQGIYTGDAPVGHIAPLAAYDARTGRALVMDPDRSWYEPYWVSVPTLLQGMNAPDSVSGKSRGYVRVSFPE